MEQLTPRQIVEELDRYIVGQQAAKKAVAIAIRNRWRRQQLPAELREEVAPKNIIMIGPTGVGKTEIARRMALLLHAPFIKVEASKFTEVGYVGRDVESIVRELAESAVNLVRREGMDQVKSKARARAEDRLLALVIDQHHQAELEEAEAAAAKSGPGESADDAGADTPEVQVQMPRPGQPFDLNSLGSLIEGLTGQQKAQRRTTASGNKAAGREARRQKREQLLARLRQSLHKGELDTVEVEISIADRNVGMVDVSGQGLEQMGVDFQGLFERIVPQKTRTRRAAVPEAMRLLTEQEAEKLVDRDKAVGEAVRRCEQSGIVFIDEIDKVCGSAGPDSGGGGGQPAVSREGVQRDLLPIIEGSTVNTKYGPVHTQHILFIAAGAFHIASPSDLIPELQGRFPVRVELQDLTRDDFVRILTEPKNALIRQYQELLKTDGVELIVTPDGIDEIARIAEQVNDRHENIGARRLHTILERLLEDIAFQAPEVGETTFTLDRESVFLKLAGIIDDEDMSRYVL